MPQVSDSNLKATGGSKVENYNQELEKSEEKIALSAPVEAQ